MIQSIRKRESAGTPLPTVYPSLAEAGTELYRGQLALVVAGPGVGKSALSLSLALRSGVSCMYFSADSDRFEQSVRGVQMLMGWDRSTAASTVRRNDSARVEDQIANVPIRFLYDASPTLGTIELNVESYEEVYGDYPELIVVDNVTNVRSGFGEDDTDPFSGLEGLMDWLHGTARQTQACVIGLHHVTGKYNDADEPIPLSGVKGQITRVPELVLSLHRRPGPWGDETLAVSTVKNRAGRQDPTGNTFVELGFDGGSMSITDVSEEREAV